jgi:CxxC motif-containing protein
MEIKHLTCICCPKGCQIAIGMENGEVSRVEGNGCRRGDGYAREEVTHPMRMLTSTVTVSGGSRERVSVKTSSDIPKDAVFDVMDVIDHMLVPAPVDAGDVLVKDVCGLGVSLVATAAVQGR